MSRELAFPRLCGLLAVEPTRLSQAMHNAGFKHLGLDYSYVAFDCEDTARALEAVRVLGIRGLSLTIPHKEAAVGMVDSLSEEARAIGAINTLLNSGTELIGYNTDSFGIAEALKEASVEVSKKQVLVLGAGGAARAAVYALKELGAKSIVVVNRTEKRGQDLAKTFGVEFRPLGELEKALEETALFINATPFGSALLPATESDYPFSFSALSEKHTVFDLVTRETLLTETASAKGAKVIPGSRMLLFQAVKQFELFTGKSAPVEVLEEALERELARG